MCGRCEVEEGLSLFLGLILLPQRSTRLQRSGSVTLCDMHVAVVRASEIRSPKITSVPAKGSLNPEPKTLNPETFYLNPKGTSQVW